MTTRRTIRVQTALAGGFVLTCGFLQAQTATTTTLTSITPAAPRFGQVVMLTAQVAPAWAPGTVSFEDRGVLIGVGTLNSGGIATVSTVTLPMGTIRSARFTEAAPATRRASPRYRITP